MTNLHDILQTHVSNGSLPGALGLVARGDRVEVQVVGSVDIDGTSPMARDSIFRIASITKPITAAAVMMLVEDGRIALDDPVGQWLPELASPTVVRIPAGPVDDVVPAPDRLPWSICSPPVPGTASRPTSRCRRSDCCSAS
jgi:CubicO group peptidase (beta-lactamase class C family)